MMDAVHCARSLKVSLDRRVGALDSYVYVCVSDWLADWLAVRSCIDVENEWSWGRARLLDLQSFCKHKR